jgi:hypothetical protein
VKAQEGQVESTGHNWLKGSADFHEDENPEVEKGMAAAILGGGSCAQRNPGLGPVVAQPEGKTARG